MAAANKSRRTKGSPTGVLALATAGAVIVRLGVGMTDLSCPVGTLATSRLDSGEVEAARPARAAALVLMSIRTGLML